MAAVVPINSTLTVTTAGTATRCTADTSLLPSSIYFEALGTNTGYIYVGRQGTVSSTAYITRLSAGQGMTLQADGAGGDYRARGQGLQLSQLAIDCSVSGEKCQMTYQNIVGDGL